MLWICSFDWKIDKRLNKIRDRDPISALRNEKVVGKELNAFLFLTVGLNALRKNASSFFDRWIKCFESVLLIGKLIKD